MAVEVGTIYENRHRETIRLPQRPGWQKLAACRGLDPELFFPTRGDSVPPEVKETCASCPVRADCLEFGLWERQGIWGGESDRGRRRLRKRRMQAA